MGLEQAITWAFLIVSLIGFTVQVWALIHIVHAQHAPGLVRTSSCRAACAVIYVLVGFNALTIHWAVIAATFIAFCITQATWQINALMDVRLGSYRPQHRR